MFARQEGVSDMQYKSSGNGNGPQFPKLGSMGRMISPREIDLKRHQIQN